MATYTNLDAEIYSQAALEGFVKKLLPLMAFSRNFSAQPGTQGTYVLVPLISSLTATTFTGSYAVCGGTKSVVTVTLNRHKRCAVGQNDLDAWNNTASNLESFGFQQGAALGTAVIEDILTICNTANFSQSTAVAGASHDVPQIRKARLDLNTANVPMDPRSYILDCVPYDALLSVTNFVQAHMFRDNGVLAEGKIMRALGFDMYEVNSSFTAPSVIGFACHANAIAVAMRYLAPQAGHNYSDARAITDPETGITIGLRDHYDENTGERYINLEANYGYSVGISNGGRCVKRSD